MKVQKTLTAIVIFVILFLILIIQKKTREPTTVKNLPIICSPDENEITSIEIEGKDHIIFIKTEDDIWELEKPVSYPANETYIKNIINSIKDLKITDLISENTSGYEDFGLTPKNGTKISVFTGKEKNLEFLIGKTNLSSTHTFIKLYSDPKIYQVSGNIGHIFNRKARDFRDKKIFDISWNEINKITIEKAKDTIILNKRVAEKKEEVVTDTIQVKPEERFIWIEESTGKVVEEDKMKTILNGIKGLSAQDFIDNPTQKQRIKEYAFTLTVEANSQKNVLKVSKKKEENQYLVEKKGITNTIFLVSNYQIDKINQSRSSLNLK
jgi:hypothetical protein